MEIKLKALFYYKKIGDSTIVLAESPSTIEPNNGSYGEFLEASPIDS
jgi:hypothetical protein